MKKALFLITTLLFLCGQGISASAAENEDINKALRSWIEDVNHKDIKRLESLYSEHADLHPTLSGELRSSRKEIDDYFRHFLSLKDLHAESSNAHILVFDNVAINDGFYNFSFNENGKPKELKARFSFTYLKESGVWKIIDHHSSAIPAESPQSSPCK